MKVGVSIPCAGVVVGMSSRTALASETNGVVVGVSSCNALT